MAIEREIFILYSKQEDYYIAGILSLPHLYYRHF